MIRTRRQKKNRLSNRMGILAISLIVLMLCVVISIKAVDLKDKQAELAAREAALEEQIQEEEARTAEIEEEKVYRTTKQYIEQVAKEKLGLVYEDEIIFRSND
jgi:cell division protein DivIC